LRPRRKIRITTMEGPIFIAKGKLSGYKPYYGKLMREKDTGKCGLIIFKYPDNISTINDIVQLD
jgi:hypothetical protein